MSKGRYVATWIDKIADVDTKDGCTGQGRCVLAEQINIDADTLPKLLVKLGELYGTTIPTGSCQTRVSTYRLIATKMAIAMS